MESVCKNPVSAGFSCGSSHNRKSDLLRTLYNNISGFLNASKVELADDVVAQSLATIEKIGEEGIVLAKNDDLLPLQEDVKRLNVGKI